MIKNKNRKLRQILIKFSLFKDLGNDASPNRPSTLPDREPQPFLNGNGVNERNVQRGVVPGHDHLRALRQLYRARDVGRPHEELRPVVREERRVPPTLVLRQDVDLGLEGLVALHRARFVQHLAPPNVVPFQPSQKGPDVVPRLSLVQHLLEHFDAGACGLYHVFYSTKLHIVPDLNNPCFNPSSCYCSPSGDGKNIFDWH
mmetsp:Transcript_7619/g.11430  ORF Transcript_7619/g.11430 Transcript_7619/m.11430 type:complete len:201 (+) Transcript_7619:36-638(+)